LALLLISPEPITQQELPVAQSSTGPAGQQDAMSKDKMDKDAMKKDGMKKDNMQTTVENISRRSEAADQGGVIFYASSTRAALPFTFAAKLAIVCHSIANSSQSRFEVGSDASIARCSQTCAFSRYISVRFVVM
jgi:hypothetical protein